MTTIPFDQLLSPDSLTRALLDGDRRLGGLLTHTPDGAGALAAAAEAAARELPRAELVAALLRGLDELEAPAAAREAAELLGTPGTVVVVAGQQPGLLGGPLMVLVKALAAAAEAARLTAAGAKAVPVFWHASEDHDHGEADHVSLSRAGVVKRLRLALPNDKRMLAAVEMDAAGAALVASVLADLDDAGSRLADVLAPRDGEMFGTWTGRFLASTLGPLGIVVVEPKTLRSVALPVIRHELAHPGALAAAIARTEERVTAAGFTAPLALPRPELFFIIENGRRRRVAIDVAKGRFAIDDDEGGSLDSLRERAERTPASFSWNVALRVLAQDWAMPVAAQICGPSEFGYVALLRECHEALGLPQPAALLRPGVTLVDPATARACVRLDVAPEAVVLHGAAAIAEPPIDGRATLERLRAVAAELPESAQPSIDRRRRELLRQIDLYAEALARDSRDRDAARTRRSELVLRSLRPNGKPAERVLSPLPWLARYGERLPRALLAELGKSGSGHLVLQTAEILPPHEES